MPVQTLSGPYGAPAVLHVERARALGKEFQCLKWSLQRR
jgi:hypothetical protein